MQSQSFRGPKLTSAKVSAGPKFPWVKVSAGPSLPRGQPFHTVSHVFIRFSQVLSRFHTLSHVFTRFPGCAKVSAGPKFPRAKVSAGSEFRRAKVKMAPNKKRKTNEALQSSALCKLIQVKVMRRPRFGNQSFLDLGRPAPTPAPSHPRLPVLPNSF